MIGAWTVGAAAIAAGGTAVGDPETPLLGAAIDSRESRPGDLFVALVGEKADGRSFAADAAARGASAALVTAPVEGLAVPQIVVADTLEALQRLGAENRRRFCKPVAAVTGSSGKTTTRRLIAAICGAAFRTHEPRRNFNNHIGVPLTLLELSAEHDRAVLELGCSDFGEIALLARLSRPDVALVTNVGPAHLEKLGSLEGVARAKGELFAGLSPSATAVVNRDDPRVAGMPVAARDVLTYGAAAGADVRLLGRRPRGAAGQEIRVEVGGREELVEIRLAGRHNATNAVAAIAAAATALGCAMEDARRGLAALAATPGRLCVRIGARGAAVVDDTYNANPASMGAALEVLEELSAPGARIAVLGDMLELGEASDAAHDGIGAAAARAGLLRLVTIGDRARRIGAAAVGAGLDAARWVHADGHAEAARLAVDGAAKGVAILVKESRGMRMENVVRAVCEEEV